MKVRKTGVGPAEPTSRTGLRLKVGEAGPQCSLGILALEKLRGKKNYSPPYSHHSHYTAQEGRNGKVMIRILHMVSKG